jgi:pimeloyl-ACP methyl ester carboxylesterase
MRKILWWLLGVVVLGHVIALLAMRHFGPRITFPGVDIVAPPAPPALTGLEVLHLELPAADVEALFLPATSGSGARPLMIFAHGNGELTDFWADRFDSFRVRGIGVLLVEYPGYGRSTGKPSEDSLRAAMDAAYDRIAADPRVDRARIFAMGYSLGGGAVCLLARDRPLRALILQSTFPSLAMFAARYHAPTWLIPDFFDNVAALKEFVGPVLVINGSRDTTIPWQEGERLAKASSRAIFRRYDCPHACWDPEHLPFWADAEPFLRSAGLLE